MFGPMSPTLSATRPLPLAMFTGDVLAVGGADAVTVHWVDQGMKRRASQQPESRR